MTELVKQEAGALTIPKGIYGAGDDISASDISIGRIAVLQSMSKLVMSEEGRRGAFVDMENNIELGYKDEKPLEFIIVKSFKYWVVKENKKFKERFPAIDSNELKKVEGNITRMYHHSFFILLPNEIADDIELPYEIVFRSTELPVAKKLSKIILNMKRKDIASWDKTFTLKCFPKTNDDGTWFATEGAIGRDTTEKEKQLAYKWWMSVNSGRNIVTSPVDDEEPAQKEVRY